MRPIEAVFTEIYADNIRTRIEMASHWLAKSPLGIAKEIKLTMEVGKVKILMEDEHHATIKFPEFPNPLEIPVVDGEISKESYSQICEWLSQEVENVE